MGAQDPAGSLDNRPSQQPRFAKQFQRHASSDDIHDRIHRADFVKMHFLGGQAVDFPLRHGNSVEEGWYIDLPRVLRIPTYREMAWRTNDSIEPGRSLWICPANPRRSNGNNLFHYCLNEHVNGTGTGNQVKLASLRHPVRVVWLFDNGKLAAVAQQNNVHTNLHSRGAQFTFLDGHSARFKNVEYWDFPKNAGRTNNPSLIWIP